MPDDDKSATVIAFPSQADPHVAWGQEWLALDTWCSSPETHGRDLAEFPQWYRLKKLEELIASTPARTLAGVREQVRFVLHYLPEGQEQDRDALRNALATLDRLVGEGRARAMTSVAEMRNFPNGRHDDQVDAIAQAVIHLGQSALFYIR